MITQHRKEQAIIARWIFGITTLTIFFAMQGFSGATVPVKAKSETIVNKPIQVVNIAPRVVNKVVNTPKLDPIRQEIKNDFGDYYDKAIFLLTNSVCPENPSLKQSSYNRNWSKIPGIYWSTDWGVFQINDKFHPVKELHLDTDYKANIFYAWRMFKNDGFTFSKRWSCGTDLKFRGYDI